MYKLLLLAVIVLCTSQNFFFSPSVKVCQQHYECNVGEFCLKQDNKPTTFGRCSIVKGSIEQPEKKQKITQIPLLSDEEFIKRLNEAEKSHQNPESHQSCGNEHMHYRSNTKSFNPTLQSPCGSTEACDNPTTRNTYTTPPNLSFKVFWMVFNCTGQEAWYQNAPKFIAEAHTSLNNIYAPIGYKFIPYITYYRCSGTKGDQDFSSFDSDGNNAITAVNTEIGTTYQRNGGFVIVSGKPVQSNLGGFMYLPLTGYSYSGIGFMNYAVVGAKYTTLPHEMGHAFGLYHTFKGVSETSSCSCAESTASDLTGDYCSDTPPVARNWECSSPISTSSFPDPCTTRGSQWNPNPYTNLMSYGDCRNGFTENQIRRVRCYQDRNMKWLINDPAGANYTNPIPTNPTNPTNPNGASSTKISLFGAFVLLILALLQ